MVKRERAVLRLMILALALLAPASLSALPAAPLVSTVPIRGGFAIAAAGRAATIRYDPADAAVVRHAATDLAGDVARVTGTRPALEREDAAPAAGPVILIGTLGHNRAIDRLVMTGRLDVAALRGAWESFVVAVVRRPAPGNPAALVVVGSDRRGTAFGVYELAEAMGVSPWHWWADVPAARHDALWVAASTRRFGPPSVRYRGIFINDEDWGLHPWAANTHEPAAGGIGPKTYARVFQLLLRLKANTLWPAMHRVSPPFNADPANAALADEYAIVMGSSHAEPMLRNNVGEWQGPGDFNYANNAAAVRDYWEARVRTNARFESLWTIGIRGIHDSGMLGADTDAEKVALLERVFADQRAMLARHVDPDPARVPQVFMPYKEVLDIYRRGLRVPDDVTLMWPDDNFGYIRQFPNAAERARAGGSGVYYHLSYLGAPLSYLWLPSTPPALIAEEMARAFDAGARTMWIANVGDIKPAEIGMTLFLEMGWDVARWRGRGQRAFLNDWARRTFGAGAGPRTGAILDDYYALNWERRPEHLQWWLPGERPRRSPLSPAAAQDRLAAFSRLEAALGPVEVGLDAAQHDAFFELVGYPVRAAAAANRRFFASERYAALIDDRPAEAHAAAAMAVDADAAIEALTARFNDTIAGGKWRDLMAEEPADAQWPQFRQVPPAIAAPGLRRTGAALMPAPADPCARPAVPAPATAGWRLAEGLGRSRRALVATRAGAAVTIAIDVPPGCRAMLALVPTFPADGGDFTLDIAVDGAAGSAVTVPREAGTRPWTAGVLDNMLAVPLPADLAPGRHRLRVRTGQPGLVVDGIVFERTAAAAHGH